MKRHGRPQQDMKTPRFGITVLQGRKGICREAGRNNYNEI